MQERAEGESRRLGLQGAELISAVRPVTLVVAGLLPAAIIVYLAFQSGGSPPGIPAMAATLLLLLLAIRALVAPNSVRLPSLPGIVCACALAAFAFWELASGSWSDSPARAVIDFSRTSLYLVAFVFFATLPQLRRSWVLRSVALGLAVVAVVALATRLRPDLFPTEATLSPGRLSYPLTYWNALGLSVACAIVLCLHLTSDGREPWPIRILAAALLPALGVTVYLTGSRGGMGCAALGVALYVVLGRPRGLVLGLLAAAPASYLALRTAYDATALIGEDPTGAAARAEGRELVGVVLEFGLLAAALRALFVPFDRHLLALRLPRASATLRRVALGSAVAVLLVGAVAAGAPAKVKDEADSFLNDQPTSRRSEDPRDRLTNFSSPGRVEHWRVLLDASRDHRVRGDGAATFELTWNRDRRGPSQVTEAHSLYVETLGELGIVGLALLTAALVAALAGIVLSARGRRPVAAAAGIVVLMWMGHAGIDWDWEMPAVTFPIFVLAGACAAQRRRPKRTETAAETETETAAEPPRRRAKLARLRVPAVVLGCLLLAIVPARTALSQARLDRAVDAYNEGDCRVAVDRATAARSALGSRPEPSVLLGLCAARAGKRTEAVAEIQKAIGDDPAAWEHHYALALVIGATGGDPRPALRDARRRSPLDRRVTELGQLLRSEPRLRWPAVCRDFAPVVSGFERAPIGG